MASLVFSGLVKHGFAAKLDIDYDYAIGSSNLVGEQAKDVGREALEVWVVEDIREATHDMRWS